MTDPQGIENAVSLMSRNFQFDVVFLQAGGVLFTPDYQTVEIDGQTYEKTVFQNTIGGYITLAALRKHGLLAPGARVIFAGGEGARGLPPLIDKPDFESADMLREYVTGDFSNAKSYKPMNAIGTSKLMSGLLVKKLAELEGDNFSTIWFSPGLTYGTQGLKNLSRVRRWVSENVLFTLMKITGRAQGPRDGARKYADVIEGKIGRNGDIIGAPEGKGIGTLTDQVPMNRAFSDSALIEELWDIVNEVVAWEFAPYAVQTG